jgi:hypothetical protein
MGFKVPRAICPYCSKPVERLKATYHRVCWNQTIAAQRQPCKFCGEMMLKPRRAFHRECEIKDGLSRRRCFDCRGPKGRGNSIRCLDCYNKLLAERKVERRCTWADGCDKLLDRKTVGGLCKTHMLARRSIEGWRKGGVVHDFDPQWLRSAMTRLHLSIQALSDLTSNLVSVTTIRDWRTGRTKPMRDSLDLVLPHLVTRTCEACAGVGKVIDPEIVRLMELSDREERAVYRSVYRADGRDTAHNRRVGNRGERTEEQQAGNTARTRAWRERKKAS